MAVIWLRTFARRKKCCFQCCALLCPQSAPMIEHLVRDHEQIRQAMTQLKTGAGLAKSIFDLGDLLERHIRKEERELFPLFEQQVSASQAESDRCGT